MNLPPWRTSDTTDEVHEARQLRMELRSTVARLNEFIAQLEKTSQILEDRIEEGPPDA